MFTKSKLKTRILLAITSLLSIVVILILGTQILDADTVIKIAFPNENYNLNFDTNSQDETNPDTSIPLILPLLYPPGMDMFAEVSDFDEFIRATDNRPIAQFNEDNAKLAKRVSIFLPESLPESKEGEISFQILASLSYEIDGSQFFVTTILPSSEALKYSFGLGNTELELRNNMTGWLMTDIESKESPNKVTFIDGNVIVEVTSNSSLDTLTQMAGVVTVMR
jgi:hypothetical protein